MFKESVVKCIAPSCPKLNSAERRVKPKLVRPSLESKIVVELGLKKEYLKDLFQDSIFDLLSFIDDAFKDKWDVTLSPNVSLRREALEKEVDDRFQKKKEMTSKVDGKASLPLLPKGTPKALTQNFKQKEMVIEYEEEYYEDYVFKFLDHYVCKLMERGFENVIQCQRTLQEMHLRSHKQLNDLELKVDNANAHHQT
ncbi:hypothetical protein E5676_scaffold1163G00070 [Cucumis melo var. makuwa]|uniref:Uncharacterized protein n=1 Tax=Cucumis melo var. makuwa TaxID=1194695 RepID=A0A5D3DG66_CUCMM|nr:hypothetical protein E6C27_scaffold43052G00310 [Cucumis melo var. makuwa]TYK22691.1 hypothetical protein E5676_scaffold1163G00070 [Cucumis melo var. makuwa]